MIKRKLHVLVDGHLVTVGEASVDAKEVIREIHISSLPSSGAINLIIETKNSIHGPCMINVGSIEIDRHPNPMGIGNQLQLAI